MTHKTLQHLRYTHQITSHTLPLINMQKRFRICYSENYWPHKSPSTRKKTHACFHAQFNINTKYKLSFTAYKLRSRSYHGVIKRRIIENTLLL